VAAAHLKVTGPLMLSLILLLIIILLLLLNDRLPVLKYREIEKLRTLQKAIIFCWFNAQTTRHTALTINVYNLS
jgi:hypothetical protein